MSEKNLFIYTYGCQMNVHDSEKIAALMKSCGYRSVDDAGQADLVIINTCSIREKAAQKVYSQLGRLRRFKKRKPGLVIGVGGCLAQQWGAKFIERVPHLDLVFGTHNIHELPDMVAKVQETGVPVVRTEFRKQVTSLGIPAAAEKGKVTAFVTIMQGCNNFCSFCVVPHVRGREESRPPADIVNEVKCLAAGGIKEVTLLGQNVNSYGSSLGNGHDFADLIREVGSIAGIERIRFTTSHPKDLSDRLIKCFDEVDALCEHIHLPVQAGSDRILRMMNRCYSSTDYLERVAKLRSVCPGISITSDVIVGFPGETEMDFQATIDMMGEIRFDSVFSFKYSERAGTAAAELGDKVSERTKGERLQIVQSLQEGHTLASNEAAVGTVEDILVEETSKNSRDDISGRTRTNKIVNFRGASELIGRTVAVLITDAYQHSLRGRLLNVD
ncbi:MAG TPA: tRNA (N6-isopentenyl adenosine(37)-C2)-methylthiotransferase MiaB [Syntrophales bacterium]|nr:tRNA (N6-isopentenyl adenosine(37)-C2)-methylthiotransferase MiaB [Syntrophales bacterium]